MPSISGLNLNSRLPIGASNTASVAKPTLIEPAQFYSSIAQGRSIVEFFNYGCPFCQGAKPEVDKATAKLGGTAKVYLLSLGSEAAQMLAAQYGISLLPGFAVFENGQHKGTFGRKAREIPSAETIVASAKSLLGIT